MARVEGGLISSLQYQKREALFQIIFKSGLKRRAIALFLTISLLSKKSHFVFIFCQVHKIYDKNSALESVNVIWCGPTDSG